MIQVYYTLNEKELKKILLIHFCSKRFVGQQKETSVACAGGGGGMRAHPKHPPHPMGGGGGGGAAPGAPTRHTPPPLPMGISGSDILLAI